MGDRALPRGLAGRAGVGDRRRPRHRPPGRAGGGSARGSARATSPQTLQASCAIPGLYPPVRIDGVRLVDGGLRSATNLDVAAELPQKAVLGISSIAFDPGDPPVGPGRLLRTVPHPPGAAARRRGCAGSATRCW